MNRSTVCQPPPPLGATRTSHSRLWDQHTGFPVPVRYPTFFFFFFSFLSTLTWEWVWFLFDFLTTIKILLLA